MRELSNSELSQFKIGATVETINMITTQGGKDYMDNGERGVIIDIKYTIITVLFNHPVRLVNREIMRQPFRLSNDPIHVRVVSDNGEEYE